MAATADLSGRAFQLLLGLTAVALGVLAGVDPRLGIAAAIGLAFVVLVMGDLTFGLCVFAFVAFLDLLPALGGSLLSFSKIVGLLLAISWLAKVTSTKNNRNDFMATHPVFTYVLGLFVVLGATSLLWAEDPAAVRTPLMRYALNLVLFLIVFTAVRTPKQFLWAVGAYVLGATAAAAYGLAQPPSDTAYYDVSRVAGTLGDPNELASVLVPGVVLSGALAIVLKRQPLLRLGAAGAGLICAAAIFLSLSRGGLIALGVALVAAVLVAGRWRAQALVLTVCLAMGGLFYFAFVASDDAVDRVTQLEGGTGRTDLWNIGVRMVEDKPFTGVGLGNFPISSVHYLLEPGVVRRDEFIVDQPKAAHNMYLQVVAELGVVGGALFVAIIGFALLCIYRAARAFARADERGMELLARALLVALVGILTADFFISEQFSKQLWFLLGLGPALLGVAAAMERGEDRAPGEPAWRPD
ncbi:MAG TPA: O-antigen ligase family protein [Thermoleophilaceae bacterium]